MASRVKVSNLEPLPADTVGKKDVDALLQCSELSTVVQLYGHCGTGKNYFLIQLMHEHTSRLVKRKDICEIVVFQFPTLTDESSLREASDCFIRVLYNKGVLTKSSEIDIVNQDTISERFLLLFEVLRDKSFSFVLGFSYISNSCGSVIRPAFKHVFNHTKFKIFAVVESKFGVLERVTQQYNSKSIFNHEVVGFHNSDAVEYLGGPYKHDATQVANFMGNNPLLLKVAKVSNNSYGYKYRELLMWLKERHVRISSFFEDGQHFLTGRPLGTWKEMHHWFDEFDTLPDDKKELLKCLALLHREEIPLAILSAILYHLHILKGGQIPLGNVSQWKEKQVMNLLSEISKPLHIKQLHKTAEVFTIPGYFHVLLKNTVLCTKPPAFFISILLNYYSLDTSQQTSNRLVHGKMHLTELSKHMPEEYVVNEMYLKDKENVLHILSQCRLCICLGRACYKSVDFSGAEQLLKTIKIMFKMVSVLTTEKSDDTFQKVKELLEDPKVHQREVKMLVDNCISVGQHLKKSLPQENLALIPSQWNNVSPASHGGQELPCSQHANSGRGNIQVLQQCALLPNALLNQVLFPDLICQLLYSFTKLCEQQCTHQTEVSKAYARKSSLLCKVGLQLAQAVLEQTGIHLLSHFMTQHNVNIPRLIRDSTLDVLHDAYHTSETSLGCQTILYDCGSKVPHCVEQKDLMLYMSMVQIATRAPNAFPHCEETCNNMVKLARKNTQLKKAPISLILAGVYFAAIQKYPDAFSAFECGIGMLNCLYGFQPNIYAWAVDKYALALNSRVPSFSSKVRRVLDLCEVAMKSESSIHWKNKLWTWKIKNKGHGSLHV